MPAAGEVVFEGLEVGPGKALEEVVDVLVLEVAVRAVVGVGEPLGVGVFGVEGDGAGLVADDDSVFLGGDGDHLDDGWHRDVVEVEVRVEAEALAFGDGGGLVDGSVGALGRPSEVLGLGFGDAEGEGVVDVAGGEFAGLDEAAEEGKAGGGGAPGGLWGEFPGFATPEAAAPDAPIVSTGKTMRDLPTLIEALRLARVSARVHAARVHANAGTLGGTSPPANVEMVAPSSAVSPPGGLFTYEHTLRDLRSAAAIAVPLLDPYPLHGLTEIADAMACARPLIVTRAPYFDFDMEAIGCGWWVERGDVRGWTEILVEAVSDRERLARMGTAGRQWAAQHWNAEIFTQGLRRTLLDLVRR